MALINCNSVSPRNHDDCFEDGEPNRIVHVAFVLRGTSINTSSEASIRASLFIAELAGTALIVRNVNGNKPAPTIKEGKGPGLLISQPVGKEHTITAIDFQYVDNIEFWRDVENAAYNYDLYYWTSNLLWKPKPTQISVSVSDPITDDLTTEMEATFTVKWSERNNPVTFPSDANDFATIEVELPDNGITPSIQSASINTAGNIITLAYNELLSGTPNYTPSGGKTIQSQILSGSNVIVTLTPAYVNGDVITISGGGATDLTGNGVAALTNYPVTNNVLAVDSTAPTAPTLTTTGKTSTSVALSWTGSTDAVGVTGYDVYRGATLLGSTASTTFNATGLTGNTAYAFTVRAKDAAGNISVASNALSVTTDAAADTTAPTAPTLSTTGKSSSTVDLSWTGATDAVGVTGYNVYNGGTKVNGSIITGTTYTVTGLAGNTSYNFTVRALDAANNESVNSNTISVTTDTAPTGSTFDNTFDNTFA